MKNKLSLLMVAALVGNVQAVDSGQNASLNQFEHQLVTAWLKNPDLVQDIRRIKEFHKVKDQGKIANLPLQTVTGFVDPTLGKVAPGMLQQSLKQIDFAFEQHDMRDQIVFESELQERLKKIDFAFEQYYMGKEIDFAFEEHDMTTAGSDCQLPVAFMKKGDTVVAAYINDTRPTDNKNLKKFKVRTVIENLHNQHGTNLPILVNTPHRNPFFSLVTGTLYSSAKKIEVSSSHDLTMHGGTGGTVKVSHHKGDFRTNADRVTIWDSPNVNLTCDNKEATIEVHCLAPVPWNIGTVTLNDHQGRVMNASCITTVKMKNYSGTEIIIFPKAKAIIENTKIDNLLIYNDGDALIVNGKIRDLLRFRDVGGTAWLVDSTVNESNSDIDQSKYDIFQINTGGDLSKAPGMLEEILRNKEGSNEDKQKTMNAFNALWNQRQMPNKNTEEERKE